MSMKKNVRIEKISESEVKNVFGGCMMPEPGTCTCCPDGLHGGIGFPIGSGGGIQMPTTTILRPGNIHIH